MFAELLKSLILAIYCVKGMRSDLCPTKTVDNVYTKSIYLNRGSDWFTDIGIVANGLQYVWSNEIEGFGLPLKEDRADRIMTMAHILDHQQPDCSDIDVQCIEMNKIKNSVITFKQNEVTGDYWYTFEHFKIDEPNTKTDWNQYDLPWNQSNTGDSRNSSQFNLWPIEWVTQTHTCVAYDYWSQELIYLLDTNNGSNQTHLLRIALNPYDYPFNDSVVFTVQTLDVNQTIVGLFNYMHGSDLKAIYAITNDMKIFEITENQEFVEINIEFKKWIGCKPPEERVSILKTVVIIIGIVVVIVVVIVIALVCLWSQLFSSDYRNSSKGGRQTTPSAGRRTELSDATQTEVASIVTVDSNTGQPIHE